MKPPPTGPPYIGADHVTRVPCAREQRVLFSPPGSWRTTLWRRLRLSGAADGRQQRVKRSEARQALEGHRGVEEAGVAGVVSEMSSLVPSLPAERQSSAVMGSRHV
ncbi:hypothetical protein AAFF_G00279160 [Aldrovandia affinis]|uniref:Uncharacterized protein n=1 Tax=Aldrovandia affinis TaxID=143900 RepID=A0AAD7SR63_9TELE|nr:hypothetical protein AAFF_G00279160 [Aldrovandia affinis]